MLLVRAESAGPPRELLPLELGPSRLLLVVKRPVLLSRLACTAGAAPARPAMRRCCGLGAARRGSAASRVREDPAEGRTVCCIVPLWWWCLCPSRLHALNERWAGDPQNR